MMSWEKEKSRHVDFQCVRSKSISNLLEISTDLATTLDPDSENLATAGYANVAAAAAAATAAVTGGSGGVNGVDNSSSSSDVNLIFNFNANSLLQSAASAAAVIQTRFNNANASLLSPSLNNRFFNPIHLAPESPPSSSSSTAAPPPPNIPEQNQNSNAD